MKKKIFISVLLLFVASFCFAVKFEGSPVLNWVGIMSKAEFNEYSTRIQDALTKSSIKAELEFYPFDDSHKISKYEKDFITNAILNEYNVETGEVYIVGCNFNRCGGYFYTVRIDKVYITGKVDFTIKALGSFIRYVY